MFTGAFEDCSSFTSIAIPDSVTSIDEDAFNNCANLTSISIGKGIKQIGDRAFYNCSELNEINIPPTMIDIGANAFYNTGYYRNSLNWDGDALYLDNYLLRVKPIVKSFRIKDGTRIICGRAFGNCDKLIKVEIPESVISICASAFSHCKSLESVVHKCKDATVNGVLGHNAFDGCESLICVKLGASITSFGDNLFGWQTLPMPNLPKEKPVLFFTDRVQSLKCKDLTVFSEIFYTGSQTQFNSISLIENSWHPATKTYISKELDKSNTSVHYHSGDILSDDMYVLRHTLFAQKQAALEEELYGFYNNVWSEEKGRRLGWCKVYNVVGDIGEVMSLKFDDLEIRADYYDMFLADIIVNFFNASENEEISTQALKIYSQVYNGIKGMLMSSDQWSSKVDLDMEKELEFYFLNPKNSEFKLSKGTENVLKLLLKDAFDNHETTVNAVFKHLSNASKLVSELKNTVDFLNAFVDAVNAYCIALLYQNVSEQFLSDLRKASYKMTNQKYAKWFQKNLDKYLWIANDIDASFYAALELLLESATVAYNTFAKDLLCKVTYRGIGKLLAGGAGIATAKAIAGNIAKVVAAYNFTFFVMDKITKLGDRTKAYELMTYIAPIEQALCLVEDEYATTLVNIQTLETAKKYDYFYQIYRTVNIYLYEAANKFCQKSSLKDDASQAAWFKTKWESINCHKGTLEEDVRYLEIVKSAEAKIRIYDSAGDLAFESIGGNCCVYDEGITGVQSEGSLSLTFSKLKNYTFEIEPQADETVSLYFADYDNDCVTKQTEYYNINLSEGTVLAGNVNCPEKTTVGTSQQSANYNSSVLTCDDAEHSVGNWTILQEATCYEAGAKIGYCSKCNKEINQSIPFSTTHSHIELVETQKRSCTVDGVYDYRCSDCGDFISAGYSVSASGHSYTEWSEWKESYNGDSIRERACLSCGHQQTQTIPTLPRNKMITIDELLRILFARFFARFGIYIIKED